MMESQSDREAVMEESGQENSLWMQEWSSEKNNHNPKQSELLQLAFAIRLHMASVPTPKCHQRLLTFYCFLCDTSNVWSL